MPMSWDALSPYDRLVNTGQMEPRAYQINVAKSIFSGKSTLVVLPTGLGKTLIAVFAIAKALHEGGKAIILAPTKPLSEQHFASLSKLLNVDPSIMLLLTGSITGRKREELEANARVIAATPQTLSNDLKLARTSLDDVKVVVFDECHKAVGKYAYTHIADECREKGVQVIGLTASPGSNKKKVDALIATLGIDNVEIRISTDTDVAPYIMEKDTSTLYVQPGPAVSSIMLALKPIIEEHLGNLYSKGLSPFRKFDGMPKGRLIEIGNNINKITANNYKFMAMFNYIYVLDLAHAYDLVSCEGLYPFISYMDSLKAKADTSRTVRNIVNNPSVASTVKLARDALGRGEEHPKMFELVRIMQTELSGKSVIVFAQFRSTIQKITDVLNSRGISARIFVGKKNGVTQAQQQATIQDFRDGKFRVMAATSIGEEGLDIPSVDAVVFYEPVANEIRHIQRMGRAGRMKFGQVFILVARGTKDEAYLMIAHVREKRMRDLVLKVKNKLAAGPKASPRKTGQALL